MTQPHARIAIIGGGPGGYEAALVGAQLGAEVTIVERDGLGGACVLTDCVPSKTLIASSGVMASIDASPGLGLRVGETSEGNGAVSIDAPRLYSRVRALARAQSADVAARLSAEGVKVISGPGRLEPPRTVVVGDMRVEADAVLIATGAEPRVLPDAEPDGERILTWRQLYDLDELPAELIVVGSGVTGAEFASGYQALGSQVTLVSSRDRVLPQEDADAAVVVEDVFRRRGMTVLSQSRAERVSRAGDGVVVTLSDGRTVPGTHCLMTVGMVPSTTGLGLAESGVEVDERGFVRVDKVSRTSAPGVYAAGDCTGVLMLASVAAMQGRIAMWHALGEAVNPLRLRNVAATIFTDPEIATVGVQEQAVASGAVPDAVVVKQPLATNARAKMQGFRDGFVKLIASRSSGTVLGGVIVAPRASELILAVSLAVERHLTVDHVAQSFAVYPSLSGSVTEAARKLMQPTEGDPLI
ncbi:MAG: NAD(P)H-quinone dehydrogenase [Actinobacteria bacterium]|nr:NAD(P)H-quinone dehydrogenase [Actinomycetota bacterium]MBO0834145.1 NAD(P)H-quinone dehydrogenase [Actinomycetota bacterium]